MKIDWDEFSRKLCMAVIIILVILAFVYLIIFSPK